MVEGDLKTIETIVKMVSWLFPAFDFEWILPEFEENLLKELDFRIERKNSERADKFFADNNTKGVYIPKVHKELSSKRILVMEFIDGIKVTNIDGLKKLGLDPKEVTHKIIDLFSDQIFIHGNFNFQSKYKNYFSYFKYIIFFLGFVHCDPHPGNILVRKKEDSPEIVLLDHGLYRELDDNFRLNYCNLWKAIVLHDKENIEKYSKLLGAGEFSGLFSVMLTFKPPSS